MRARVAAVGGHLQNGYLKKGKDVKKDGETRAKRGERLVKNSKWISSFFMIFAVPWHFFFTPRKHALLLLGLIAARAF